ncbi:Dimethylaniline monooxygenase, partial [Lamprotornis superbus]
PTCLEQSQDIGGLWCYTVSQQGLSPAPGSCSLAGLGVPWAGLCWLWEGWQGAELHRADVVPWQEHIEASWPSLYPSLISNTSKEISAFSDFPEPFPVFLPNALLLDCGGNRRHSRKFPCILRAGPLENYTLEIRNGFIHRPVLNVKSLRDWLEVEFPLKQSQGSQGDPKTPPVTLDYLRRYAERFSLRERSRLGVTISTSWGSWLLSCVFERGCPWDMVSITLLKTLIKTSLPGALSWQLTNSKVNKRFNHTNYGLQPDNRFGLTYDEVLKTKWLVYLDTLASLIGAKPSTPSWPSPSSLAPNPPTSTDWGSWALGGGRAGHPHPVGPCHKAHKNTSPCWLLQLFPFPPGCASMVRRVAVIGAGAGGLVSVKCCLEEGLEPTCFERSEDIGGIWRYTDSTDSRRVSVYRSVITNTSKEMSCFSDFPFPQDFPSYLPHGLVLEYFRMYARHFDLLRHVRFQVSRDPKPHGEKSHGYLQMHDQGPGWPHILNKAAPTRACPPVPSPGRRCRVGFNGFRRDMQHPRDPACSWQPQPFTGTSLIPDCCFVGLLCKTTVLSVRRCPDFTTSGQWEVVTEAGGVCESHIFDAVMVCTGHYQEPYLPLASFPGIESHFKGQCLHSREYRDVQDFRGKRVLVVGIGNTGGDLSVELSRVAAKVFLSTRSNTWVLSRVSDHGFPLDMVGTTRFNHLLEWLLPSALARRIRFQKFNSWFNHTNYGLASSKSSKFKMIINEELPFCLLSGTVVLKPNVKEFTESSAVFEDGTIEENIDVVLFATGYNFSFPFLEESVSSAINNNRSLYKCIFPPQLEKPTLAIIGLIQLTGSIMVGSEMQARWVTGVFAGWNKLPPPSRMMAEVLKSKPPVKRCVMHLHWGEMGAVCQDILREGWQT